MIYENGYYWVKYTGSWLIAKHHGNWWWLCGFDNDYKLSDFDKIGEYIEEPESIKE
jgi:hypothetical protein